MQHKDYFESTLQLRDVTEELINYVEDLIYQLNIKVAKSTRLKNGMDYYLSSNNLTRDLCRRLVDKYKGEFKITSTLHTKKKDKELFRLTFLFRQAQFKKGDFVEYKGDKYQVVLMAKDILLKDNSGKKEHIKYEEIDKIKKVV
jgi:NMD protein affecting ribosome stability and mRNA decay